MSDPTLAAPARSSVRNRTRSPRRAAGPGARRRAPSCSNVDSTAGSAPSPACTGSSASSAPSGCAISSSIASMPGSPSGIRSVGVAVTMIAGASALIPPTVATESLAAGVRRVVPEGEVTAIAASGSGSAGAGVNDRAGTGVSCASGFSSRSASDAASAGAAVSDPALPRPATSTENAAKQTNVRFISDSPPPQVTPVATATYPGRVLTARPTREAAAATRAHPIGAIVLFSAPCRSPVRPPTPGDRNVTARHCFVLTCPVGDPRAVILAALLAKGSGPVERPVNGPGEDPAAVPGPGIERPHAYESPDDWHTKGKP
jgi:hypothetical protein